MKVLVPVKRVADYNVKVRPKSDGSLSRRLSLRAGGDNCAKTAHTAAP